MNSDISSPSKEVKNPPLSFGSRLKTAREAMNLERKDVAQQLRLPEKVIIMMEKERYPTDLPITFIRGYIRAYAKLLQIPEYEIKKAIEPIQPKPVSSENIKINKGLLLEHPQSSFMPLLSYSTVFTVIALAGLWWYNKNPHLHTPQEMLSTLTTASATVPSSAVEALSKAVNEASLSMEPSPAEQKVAQLDATKTINKTPKLTTSEASSPQPLPNTGMETPAKNTKLQNKAQKIETEEEGWREDDLD